MSLLDLALLCLRLGLVSFGGGISTLTEMQYVVVDVHGAMTRQDFAYAFGLGQATPGPGILYLIPLGMKIAGPIGGVVAIVSFVLPPMLLVGILVRTWNRYSDSPWIAAVNKTLAPMGVGLIAASLKTVAAPLYGDTVALTGVAIATLAILRFRIAPPVIVLLGGIIWMLRPG